MPRILPPSSARIAEEVGQSLKQRYDEDGLTTYREIYTTPGGVEFVEEGWIEERELPNGNILRIKRKHKVISVEHAEQHE